MDSSARIPRSTEAVTPIMEEMRFPTELLEDILYDVLQDQIHTLLFKAGGLALHMEPFSQGVGTGSFPDKLDGADLDSYNALCETMKFGSVLHLCHASRQYRSVMERFLAKLAPPSELPVGLRPDKRNCAVTSAFAGHFSRYQLTTMQQSATPIMKSLSLLQLIGLCCIEMGFFGTRRSRHQREAETAVEFLAQTSPAAWHYFSHARKRTIVHHLLKLEDVDGNLAGVSDAFLPRIGFSCPNTTLWQKRFFSSIMNVERDSLQYLIFIVNDARTMLWNLKVLKRMLRNAEDHGGLEGNHGERVIVNETVALGSIEFALSFIQAYDRPYGRLESELQKPLNHLVECLRTESLFIDNLNSKLAEDDQSSYARGLRSNISIKNELLKAITVPT